ncbi:MAG: hypothetical protein CMH53_09490 [Myxococcales bacterium]|nr:hypothetical protein [Myxococcales bacterium]
MGAPRRISMKRMTTILALLLVALFTTPAFANDASSGSSDAGAASDAVSQPGPATGTTSFNENACWDEKCPKETAACKADDLCSKFVGCMKAGKSSQECGQELQLDQTKADALNKLLNPLQECGWKACADPDGGTCEGNCGKYLGRAAKCQCDDQCEQYGDCCSDYAKLCKETGGGGTTGGSCVGKCDSPYDANADCQCDSECATNQDCCSDYQDVCSGACKPACAGKQCGDDSCGGVCGTCAQGSVCDATGQCQQDNKPEPDAGSTTDTSGGGTGGVIDAGNGNIGGGGSTAPVAKAPSSGCNASSTSPHGALPCVLFMLSLLSLVVLRRRAA